MIKEAMNNADNAYQLEA